jgi:hypothetical protein
LVYSDGFLAGQRIDPIGSFLKLRRALRKYGDEPYGQQPAIAESPALHRAEVRSLRMSGLLAFWPRRRRAQFSASALMLEADIDSLITAGDLGPNVFFNRNLPLRTKDAFTDNR